VQRGDRICVLLAAGNAGWEVEVLGALEAAGMVVLRRCVDVPDLLAAATTGQAAVAVVAGELPDLDADAVTHLLRHDVRPVAVVSSVDPGDRLARLGLAAVRAGESAGDPDVAGAVVAAVEDAAVGRMPPDPEPVAEPALPVRGAVGRVVAVWGPAGAPGRSTVAAGLAGERATREACVLVDADPYGGSLAQALGILDEVSGLLAAARLANTGSLDAASFAACRRRVGDRLDVLTGLPRADRWVEVRAGVLPRILELATEVGDVVVDCGFSLEEDELGLGRAAGRNQLTLDALAGADEVVVVGAADPVGLSRLARALMELRERVAPARVRVVVNRMRDSLGWREQDVLGMVEGYAAPVGIHLVPDDRGALDRALLAGRCLVETGDSPVRRALARVAADVFPAPAQLPKSR
jgi:MinD-like ATPase involved in chromosome partitioning or flagellar assembly